MLHCTFPIRTAARCCSPHASSRLVYGGVRRLVTPHSTTTTRGHGKEHDADTDTCEDTTGGWPQPVYASARTEAKKSIFVAHASQLPVASPLVLRAFLAHLTAQPALKRATHCMYAWRVVSQAGSNTTSNSNAYTSTKTSSSPGTRQILTGQNDGGETGAGERLAHLLEATNCANVVVVVSRWYGGVKLGSERWKMISGVAKDALARGDFSKGKRPSDPDTPSLSAMAGSGNKKKRKK